MVVNDAILPMHNTAPICSSFNMWYIFEIYTMFIVHTITIRDYSDIYAIIILAQ